MSVDRRGYRVSEASAQYGFSERQGWRLVATGEWPAIRVGRATIITAGALEEWERRKLSEETAGGLGSYAAASVEVGGVSRATER
jgi:hypothetical protein